MGRRWWSGQWWLSEKYRPSRPTCAPAQIKAQCENKTPTTATPFPQSSLTRVAPRHPDSDPVPFGDGRLAADETLTTALRSPDVGSGAAEADGARVRRGRAPAVEPRRPTKLVRGAAERGTRRSVRGVGASAGSGAAEAGGCTRRPTPPAGPRRPAPAATCARRPGCTGRRGQCRIEAKRDPA